MSARPLRPAPLVSRPRPVGPQAKPPAWWSRRWALAGGIAALSLAGLLAIGMAWLPVLGHGPSTAVTRLASARAVEPATSLSPPAPSTGSGAAPNTAAGAHVSSVAASPTTSLPQPSPSANFVDSSALPATALANPAATPRPAATETPAIAAVPTSAPSPSGTPTLLDELVAKSLVERYYAAINARDFRAAYGLLGAQWRQRQTYDDFAAGYRSTVRDTVTVTGTASATKDSLRGYVVALDLNAQLAGRLQRYKGLYFVALEDGQPRIQNGELSPR